MNQLFDSRDPFHRRPVGAVEEETRIHFKIRLPRDLRCSASYLLVQDDKSKNDMVSSMFWCGMDGDGMNFGNVTLPRRSPGFTGTGLSWRPAGAECLF